MNNNLRRHTGRACSSLFKPIPPPPPFSRRYKNAYTIRSPVKGLPAEIDRLDFALSNPPLETLRPEQAKSQVLTVLKRIDRRQYGEVGGAHVVSCYLDSDKSRHYVAKIYDGIDYPLTNHFDCMYLADRDYSCEATAYQNIPLSLQGSIVPRYFGSWTFSVETGVPARHRWVRLILLEHFDGECMLDMILRAKGLTQRNLPPAAYDAIPVDFRLLPSEPARLSVLASIIEAESRSSRRASTTGTSHRGMF